MCSNLNQTGFEMVSMPSWVVLYSWDAIFVACHVLSKRLHTESDDVRSDLFPLRGLSFRMVTFSCWSEVVGAKSTLFKNLKSRGTIIFFWWISILDISLRVLESNKNSFFPSGLKLTFCWSFVEYHDFPVDSNLLMHRFPVSTILILPILHALWQLLHSRYHCQ